MRVNTPGKITEGLWLLGCRESCIYLLEGKREAMLISGGLSYVAPMLLRQFKEFDIDENRIKKLIILHAHFDHVGVVPFLKRRHPDLEILASMRAWEILHMPKAIPTINAFGQQAAKRMDFGEAYATYDLDWRNDITGRSISEGDVIDLGGLRGLVYETPGHSSCSLSLYVPEIKALFPSDGGGIPYKGGILASGNSNYTSYQQSLERLKALEVNYLCADHYGYVTGEEAEGYIRESAETAKTQRKEIEELFLKTHDIPQAAHELVNRFYARNPDYIIPPEVFEGVYRQMVRHIAADLTPASIVKDG